jgi:hypothetical protein
MRAGESSKPFASPCSAPEVNSGQALQGFLRGSVVPMDDAAP